MSDLEHRRRRLTSSAFALAAVLAALVLYAPAISAPFVFDDYSGILTNDRVEQAALRPWTAFRIPSERPLTVWLLALERRCFGLRPAFYHAASLILHLLNILLAAAWVRRWTGSNGAGDRVLPWVPLLFAIHPLASEAVAYVWSCSTLLESLFVLLALLALQERRPIWRWTLAGVAAGFALLAKEDALILPLVLIWADFCDRRSSKGGPAPSIARTVMMAAVAAFAALWLLRWALAGLLPEAERFLRGALTQARVLIANFELLLWPINLCADRAENLVAGSADPWAWLAVLLTAALATAAWRLRRQDGLAAFALGWIVLQALPYFAVPLAEIRVERRLYLSTLAFALLAARSIRLLPGRLRHVAPAAVGVLMAVLLQHRVPVWTNEVRLWQDTIRKAPSKPRAWNNLGVALQRSGRMMPARRAFEQAVRLHPLHEMLRFNLGKLCRQLGDWECARRELVAAQRLYALRATTQEELGLLDLDQGRAQQAESHFRAAIELAPAERAAWQNLGLSLARRGRWEEALESFERASEIDPESAELRLNLGVALLALQRPAAAKAQLEKALRIRPDLVDARFLLGQAAQRLGDREGARRAYLEVLAVAPARDDARTALESLGRQKGG